MNKNILIGTLVVVVLGVGTYFVATYKPTTNDTGSQATSTDSTTPPPPVAENPPPPPAQPAAPVVETVNNPAPSNTTVVVSGNVSPNGAPTSYWYEYGTSNNLGSRTPSQSIGSGFRSVPAPDYITGLTPSTHYFFRIAAQNRLGTTNGGIFEFSTNTTPPPVGNPPTTQTNAASAVTNTTANLNGRVNPRGNQTSYWYEYGTTTDLGNTTNFQSAGSGTASNNVTVPIAGLAANTKYYFRLNAQSQFGTVNGATQSFTTKKNPAPTDPSAETGGASNITASDATLNGRVNPNRANTTYWFEYSPNTLVGNLIGTATPKRDGGSGAEFFNVSIDVKGLASNTKYYYRLVAQNEKGTTRGSMMNFTTSK